MRAGAKLYRSHDIGRRPPRVCERARVRSSLIFASAASSSAFSSRHWPGARSPEQYRTDGKRGPAARSDGRRRLSSRRTWRPAASLADHQAAARRSGRSCGNRDWHGSIGDRGSFGQQIDQRRPGRTVIQHDAPAQPVECLGIGNSLDLHQIGFGMVESRVSEAMRDCPSSVKSTQGPRYLDRACPPGRSLDRDEFFEGTSKQRRR